jgi:hypothetical protein
MNIEFLRQVNKLPLDAVFGLISISSKECYISHTVNLKTRIGQILTDNEDILKDDTELIVFCTGIVDNEYKRIYAQYYLDMYVEAGFKNISPTDNYINYKIRVQYSDVLQEVFVLLVNTRKDKKIVGVFKQIEEAEQFVAQYYPDGSLVQPIYALNEDTKKGISTDKDI